MKKLTTEQFIKRAKEVHEDKYDYSLVEYVNAKTKVKIICPEHGIFEQLPSHHIRGRGCRDCGNERQTNKRTLTTQKFIEKSVKKHGNKYNYSKSLYINAKSKVDIICPIHGEFQQLAFEHYNGQGCPKCGNKRVSDNIIANPVGWSYTNWQKAAEKSKNFDSFKVYIIKCWNESEEFYKIGKTYVKIEKRFIYKKEMPYNYEILKIYTGKAKEICNLEKRLQKENKHHKYIPKLKFNGMYECFKKVKINE